MRSFKSFFKHLESQMLKCSSLKNQAVISFVGMLKSGFNLGYFKSRMLYLVDSKRAVFYTLKAAVA